MLQLLQKATIQEKKNLYTVHTALKPHLFYSCNAVHLTRVSSMQKSKIPVSLCQCRVRPYYWFTDCQTNVNDVPQNSLQQLFSELLLPDRLQKHALHRGLSNFKITDPPQVLSNVTWKIRIVRKSLCHGDVCHCCVRTVCITKRVTDY